MYERLFQEDVPWSLSKLLVAKRFMLKNKSMFWGNLFVVTTIFDLCFSVQIKMYILLMLFQFPSVPS